MCIIVIQLKKTVAFLFLNKSTSENLIKWQRNKDLKKSMNPLPVCYGMKIFVH